MPRLTHEQKSIIFTRLQDGKKIREIAAELGVNKNTILLAKQKIEEYGAILQRPTTGRPRVSTANEDYQLVQFLRDNPFETAVNAREETNFPGSANTARRRIRLSNLKNCAASNKIFLTEANKQRRVEFAREYVDRDIFWENVVFSDEKTFQSCHNGTLRVYRPVGMRYDERYTRKLNKSGRFCVNVWGWISIRGPGVCAIIEEKLNANVYCNILENIMLPSVRPVFGDNFVFQQDNCPIHKARLVQNFMQNNNITTLPWVSKSPDLNPIENVWGEMAKQIYKAEFRPRNQDDLRQSIVQAWNQITPDYIRALVSSMPRRLRNVIEQNGSMTKY